MKTVEKSLDEVIFIFTSYLVKLPLIKYTHGLEISLPHGFVEEREILLQHIQSSSSINECNLDWRDFYERIKVINSISHEKILKIMIEAIYQKTFSGKKLYKNEKFSCK